MTELQPRYILIEVRNELYDTGDQEGRNAYCSGCGEGPFKDKEEVTAEEYTYNGKHRVEYYHRGHYKD